MEKQSNNLQKQHHIVFAEHELSLERSISLMLKMAKYKVTHVSDCLDAYEKLLELDSLGQSADLLIIDFGGNQQIASRFVKSLAQSNLTVPVILIAEYGDEMLAGGDLLSESSFCISKPFEPEELMAGIEKALYA